MGSGDLDVIAEKIRISAPDREVFVVSNNETSFRIRKKAALLPTLLFSIGPLAAFKPRRGKIYCGHAFSKIQQLERLNAAGVPLPKWAVLEPSSYFDRDEWGETVVVKPTGAGAAAQGRGVQFVETKGVEFIRPEDFPRRHVGTRGPMIVQKFVDSGECPSEFRVVCLFGTPLYAVKHTSGQPMPVAYKKYILDDPLDLASSNKVKKYGYGGKTRGTDFVDDPVLLETASSTYSAIPEAPLHGVDLVREKDTGKYYVMEANPMGFTWHFSSYFAGVPHPTFNGMRREEQFDAFSIAANVLIERTRKEAE